MRQPNRDCVANFWSARRHRQSCNLADLPLSVDDTNDEVHTRSALHPAQQVFDLLDRVHVLLAYALNHKTPFDARFIRSTAGFDRRNENAAALRITERIA